uniref:Uncharacterized protein n=1 Tax=mine drainage metagenome TaxID=410659 RepID=E6QNC1_9ZZZZ
MAGREDRANRSLLPAKLLVRTESGRTSQWRLARVGPAATVNAVPIDMAYKSLSFNKNFTRYFIARKEEVIGSIPIRSTKSFIF